MLACRGGREIDDEEIGEIGEEIEAICHIPLKLDLRLSPTAEFRKRGI